MNGLVQEAAGSGGTAGVIAIVVGVVVVVALIAAFVLGARRKEKEPVPPAATDPQAGRRTDGPTGPGGTEPDGTGPDADSWSAPPSTPGRAPRGSGR